MIKQGGTAIVGDGPECGLCGEHFAPSEEFVLHCDIPGCQASVSLVGGVARSAHGWGRVSIYADASADTADYDLCSEHYLQVTSVLWGA